MNIDRKYTRLISIRSSRFQLSGMKLARKVAKRPALSAVLATLILISITIVSAVAVGGFVFGTIGTFTSGSAFSNYSSGSDEAGNSTTTTTVVTSASGSVVANPTSCTAPSKSKSKCTLDVLNSGTSTATIPKNSCIINIAGVPTAGVNSAKTIKAGKSVTVGCTVTATEPPIGSSATGFLSVQGGPKRLLLGRMELRFRILRVG